MGGWFWYISTYKGVKNENGVNILYSARYSLYTVYTYTYTYNSPTFFAWQLGAREIIMYSCLQLAGCKKCASNTLHVNARTHTIMRNVNKTKHDFGLLLLHIASMCCVQLVYKQMTHLIRRAPHKWAIEEKEETTEQIKGNQKESIDFISTATAAEALLNEWWRWNMFCYMENSLRTRSTAFSPLPPKLS